MSTVDKEKTEDVNCEDSDLGRVGSVEESDPGETGTPITTGGEGGAAGTSTPSLAGDSATKSDR